MDTTPPEITSDNFTGLAGATTLPLGTSSYTVTLQFSEPVTGVELYNTITVNSPATLSGLTGSGAGPYSFDVNNLTDNVRTSVKVNPGIIDIAGNTLGANGNICAGTCYSLPATGQTVSYTTGPDNRDDADFIYNPMSYTDNGDNTATDNVTGLMWQIPTAGPDTWSNAINYCDGLNLAGHDDWRLPSVFELSTIIDFGPNNPSIDNTIFSGTQGESYWTSTEWANNPGSNSWGIFFSQGRIGLYSIDSSYYIRCVRLNMSNTSLSRETQSGDGIVNDAGTGLMWADDTSPTELDWLDAIHYCENQIGVSGTYAGYSDWRLPNIKELSSIVDYRAWNPAIDQSVFTDWESCYYWSSTTYASHTGDAWYVYFHSGYDSHSCQPKTSVTHY